VVDEKSKFRDDNFQRAMSTLQANPLGEIDSGFQGNDKKNSRKQLTKNFQADLLKIVKLIMERQLDPCIIFSFSKKDCETYALQMAKMDFNNQEEKNLISQVFNNAIEALSEDDKELPQIKALLPLLQKGIGVHHGGLLPILKEIIEILFQEGLIKILFATETFSIGINMPAKTVVFTATRKFDGKDFRWITSGEYIQMSGRAGRRGKDDKGIVIQMIDEKMEPDIVKNMIYGASDPLYSSYHISYNMVLNMLRVEGADPSNLIKNSFHQFQQEANAPNLMIQVQELEKEKNKIIIAEEQEIQTYFQLKELLQNIHTELNNLIMQPAFILPFLQVGRMISIQFQDLSFGWGVIIEVKKTSEITNTAKNITKHLGNFSSYLGKINQVSSTKKLPISEYVLDVIIEAARLPAVSATYGIDLAPKIINVDANGKLKNEIALLQCGLDVIESLSAIRLNIPKDLSKDKNRLNIKNCINEIIRRFDTPVHPKGSATKEKDPKNNNPDNAASVHKGIPLLDLQNDLGVTTNLETVNNLISRKTDVKNRLKDNKIYQFENNNSLSTDSSSSSSSSSSEISKNIALFQTKRNLQNTITKLRKEATELQSIVMKEDLRRMKKFLKRLDYVTNENILTKKGRFACEITAGDEIVITNMIFSGLFNELSIEQAVALLSCFVHNEGLSGGSGGGSGGSGANGTGNSMLSENPVLKFRSEMHKGYRAMLTIIKDIIQSYKECHIPIDDHEYVNSFNPSLIDVTYAWAQGQKFVEICKITDVFEGSIIRSLRRLDELLRQLAAASLSIGNHELVTLFTEGSNKIRRGVVFAASLYIN
jgi:ATP-dependent RNA helicase DOB1